MAEPTGLGEVSNGTSSRSAEESVVASNTLLPRAEGDVGLDQSAEPTSDVGEGDVGPVQSTEPTSDVGESLWITLSNKQLQGRWGCQPQQVASLRKRLEAGVQARQPGDRQFTRAAIEAFMQELGPIVALYDETKNRLLAVLGRGDGTATSADLARFTQHDLVEKLLVHAFETESRAVSHSQHMAAAVSVGGRSVTEGFVAEENMQLWLQLMKLLPKTIAYELVLSRVNNQGAPNSWTCWDDYSKADEYNRCLPARCRLADWGLKDALTLELLIERKDLAPVSLVAS